MGKGRSCYLLDPFELFEFGKDVKEIFRSLRIVPCPKRRTVRVRRIPLINFQVSREVRGRIPADVVFSDEGVQFAIKDAVSRVVAEIK